MRRGIWGQGPQERRHFSTARYEEGVERARAFVTQNKNRFAVYAIAYDGYVTLEGRKWDGVFVETGMRDRETGFLLCQRYETKGLIRKRNVRVGNPGLVERPPSRIYSKC